MTEAAIKINKLREQMVSEKTQTLRLKGVDWFSWATCGGRSTVIFTSELGVAEIFITATKAWVLTNKIEQDRLAQEEVPLEFEIMAFPWEQASLLEKFIQQHSPGACYSDRPSGSEKLIPDSFRDLKLILGPEEIQRYRQVGRLAAEAMTEALTKAEPDWSENQLAGEGARALWTRGLDPALVMVGSHRRCLLHRHPIAGSEKLGESAMMVFCARGFGLYANLTRFIYFRPLTSDEERRFAMTLAVEAAAFHSSVPGKTLTELFKEIAGAYRNLNCAVEVERHHQGGPTGYLSREYVVSPESPPQVKLSRGMALAWNPSLPGAKTEDTVLMSENGIEILTVDPHWPTTSFAERSRPQVWVKS
ncbi:MAG TPA: M24 family metallopeptidase [Pseudobdellovibrionaceae bacterium]|jgi:Xaa-Pro aminopeptidase